MATTYDAANPEHWDLMTQTDEQLRLRGMPDDEIAALREAQYSAPPARSPEEVAALRKAEQKPARAERKSEGS